MDITPEIKVAIQKAIDLHGNVTQLSKSLGIAHSTILFWMSGKTTQVSGRVWAQKLRPALLPFLSDADFKSDLLGKSFYEAGQAKAAASIEAPQKISGYRAWKASMEMPEGAIVRLRGTGLTIGSMESHITKTNDLFVRVLAPNAQQNVVLETTPELALLLIETLDTREGVNYWEPAGIKVLK